MLKLASYVSSFHIDEGRSYCETQVSTETIGKVFNLEPDSILLVGYDGTVATSENGNFNSSEMESEIGWNVSGNTVSTASAGAPAQQSKVWVLVQSEKLEDPV